MREGPFREWLRRQTDRRDPVGDLARDTVQDWRDRCGRLARTPDQLRQHLDATHPDAVPGAYRAIDRAEREWRATA